MAQKVENDEKYLASAVYYLMETGAKDTANLLLTCEIETLWGEWEQKVVRLRGSAEFYETYSVDTEIVYDPDGNEVQRDGAFRQKIFNAFKAVFPDDQIDIVAGVALINFDEDWRTRLLAESETKEAVTNQNVWEKKPIIWNGMRFSSQPEVEIAKALEKTGVTYLPNCLVRVGAPSNQQTLFPDFLICYKGKWGILEVDGQTYHNGTATADYDRMRKLIQHVAYFDRYEAKKCMSEPDKVVKTFLDILGSK
jgi:hypothetical protein